MITVEGYLLAFSSLICGIIPSVAKAHPAAQSVFCLPFLWASFEYERLFSKRHFWIARITFAISSYNVVNGANIQLCLNSFRKRSSVGRTRDQSMESTSSPQKAPTGSNIWCWFFLTRMWFLHGSHIQQFKTLKLPECSFHKHVARPIPGDFFSHDVIILCTLHAKQSTHNVVNDEKSPKRRALFPVLVVRFFPNSH